MGADPSSPSSQRLIQKVGSKQISQGENKKKTSFLKSIKVKLYYKNNNNIAGEIPQSGASEE